MSELHDYFFGEIDAAAQAALEQRLADSPALREDLRRLEMTTTALRSLPGEEPPQRIAFVSDKVFQPSWGARVRGWMASAGPVLASAALSGLVVFTVMDRRAPIAPAIKTIEVVKAPSQNAGEVRALIASAVSAAEARSVEKTRALLAEADRRHDLERKQLLLDVQDTVTYMQKKMNVMQVASADFGAAR